MTIKHFLGYYIFKGTATSPVNLSRPSLERSDEYAALAGKYAACQSLLTYTYTISILAIATINFIS